MLLLFPVQILKPVGGATLAVSRDTCAAYCCVSPAPKVDLQPQLSSHRVAHKHGLSAARHAARLIGMPSPFMITLPRIPLCELMRLSVSSTTDRSPMSALLPTQSQCILESSTALHRAAYPNKNTSCAQQRYLSAPSTPKTKVIALSLQLLLWSSICYDACHAQSTVLVSRMCCGTS